MVEKNTLNHFVNNDKWSEVIHTLYMLKLNVICAQFLGKNFHMCFMLLLFRNLVTSNNCAEVEMVLLPGLIQGVGLSCEVAVEDQGHKYDQESILLRLLG